MADKYIHIFGIPVDQLSFKLDILRHIESQCDEKMPLADDGEKTYYDFDDFFNDIAPDLDCVWFSYGSMLDEAIEYWHKLLKQMIWSFKEIGKGRPHEPTMRDLEWKDYKQQMDKYDKKVQRGIDLFAEYYQGLWI